MLLFNFPFFSQIIYEPQLQLLLLDDWTIEQSFLNSPFTGRGKSSRIDTNLAAAITATRSSSSSSGASDSASSAALQLPT
jgi:hypothetical protein